MQSTYKYRFDHSTIYWTLIYIIVFVLLGGLLYHLYEGGYLSAWFTSFIVALIAIKTFLQLIKRISFIPFAIYRFVVAAVVYVIFF